MAIKASSSFNMAVMILAMLAFASPAYAFGAGFVPRGASGKGTFYRHGDILYSVYFLSHAHSTLVRQIYFGNWLRDFSQLMDRKAMEAVPEPILRAIVAIFAYLQFGYTTGEFEVTQERLGYYRPEEHIDNPRGYEGGLYTKLRIAATQDELSIDPKSGMKNYIANEAVTVKNHTSADYITKQLVAAIACGRARDKEAYTHLGAALHTLEDFLAHSNWIELCMQMLSLEMSDTTGGDDAMRNVCTFTGGAAVVTTIRGRAPPLVTGTFGALDLYQTVLGEFDDKLTTLSLPGIQSRMKKSDEGLSTTSEFLVKIFSKLDNNDFAGDIRTITKSATENPADWGKLQETPELLWDTISPVFRLRDKIVRWIYDHLTINVVADAVASISTALDKLVYRVIGTFLGPVLNDISAALTAQANELQAQDQQVRLARGEASIFANDSLATDPTHSQMCKDHYDDGLNELAGRVATKVTTYTIKAILDLWQPGNTVDPIPALNTILSALHHPFNYSKDNEIQSLMVAEVLDYTTTRAKSNPKQWAAELARLDRPHMAAKLGEEAEQIAHSHVPSMTAAYAAPNQISSVTVHDIVTVPTGGANISFIEKIATNIEKNLKANKFTGLSMDDLTLIKRDLYSKPSSDIPNPIDQSLIRIPGVGLVSVFDEIDLGEIVSAPGMGIVLKDAVIAMRLRDTEWVEREQAEARRKLGRLEDRPIKEMLRLLDFGAERKPNRPIEEPKVSTLDKVMDKLKIGKSKD